MAYHAEKDSILLHPICSNCAMLKNVCQLQAHFVDPSYVHHQHPVCMSHIAYPVSYLHLCSDVISQLMMSWYEREGRSGSPRDIRLREARTVVALCTVLSGTHHVCFTVGYIVWKPVYQTTRNWVAVVKTKLSNGPGVRRLCFLNGDTLLVVAIATYLGRGEVCLWRMESCAVVR